MAGEGFQIKGISEVSQALKRLALHFPYSAAKALNEIAEVTMTDAKERTPVEFGRLKASGNVSTHATPTRLAAQLTFGTEYAVYVHEIPARHAVGEVKFLENAVNKAAATFAQDVADGIAGNI